MGFEIFDSPGVAWHFSLRWQILPSGGVQSGWVSYQICYPVNLSITNQNIIKKILPLLLGPAEGFGFGNSFFWRGEEIIEGLG